MQVIILEYPNVLGEVMLKDKTGVMCNSISFGLSKKGNLGNAGTGDRAPLSTSSAPSNSEAQRPTNKGNGDDEEKGVDKIDVSRGLDKASPKFMTLAYTKKTDDEQTATITVYRAKERTDVMAASTAQSATAIADSAMTAWHEPFLKITLKGVHISSHKINVTASDMSEELEISFKEITMDYTVYTNGKKGGITTGKVDITTGTVT